MVVVWRTGALRDLETILAHLLDINPAAALDQVDLIDEAGKSLRRLSERGSIGAQLGTRELKVLHTPYTLIYRVTDTIEILRVWPERIQRS